jgi:hypothetical protein
LLLPQRQVATVIAVRCDHSDVWSSALSEEEIPLAEKEKSNGASRKAFVISQIGDEHSEIRARADEVLEFIIGPVAAEYNLEVVRSDLDPTPGQVTSRLIKSILESRVIIAELTGRNPNVYYELGVVHSFRLPVVILVDRVDRYPVAYNMPSQRGTRPCPTAPTRGPGALAR